MEWNPFRLTKSFPFVLGCLNPNMCPVDAANYTREPSLVVKPSLDYTCSSAGDGNKMNFFCFWARASNTSFTTLETEDFGRPKVSPMGCRKRPLTKKCNATRICSVGDSAWFLFVCRCRSFSRISLRNSIESWPNRSLLRSSLSEKSSRKISCWRNESQSYNLYVTKKDKIIIIIQSTPDNSNLQGKSKKVRVIGSLSYREFEENGRE